MQEYFKSASDLLRQIMDEDKNVEQGKAMKEIFTGKSHLFITGNAGSGKTTFMRRILPFIGPTAIVAPTGIAALNSGGQTIHSFFGLNLDQYIPEIKRKKLVNKESIRMNQQKRRIVCRIKNLIIDEVSMVKPELLDRVADVLRQVRDSKEPFGGVRLIMFGDLFQLPPVTKFDDISCGFYDSKYFFASKSLKLAGFKVFEFKKIFRQRDESFINILNSIRVGSVTNEQLDELNKRAILPTDDDPYITICSTNNKASSINDARIGLIEGDPFVFEAIKNGDAPKDAQCEELLKLKIGAQVIITRNGEDYVNGTIGTVEAIAPRIGPDNKTLTNQPPVIHINIGNDKTVGIVPVIFEKRKAELVDNELKYKTVGSITQYPLRLGYAITSHKVQGMTLDKALIDINDAFDTGQTYVALSRCRSMEGVFLPGLLSKEAIKVDDDIVTFFNMVNMEEGYVKPVSIEELIFDKRELNFDMYGL